MTSALRFFRSLTASNGWLVRIVCGCFAALVIAPLIVAVRLESRERKAWRAGHFAVPPGTP